MVEEKSAGGCCCTAACIGCLLVALAIALALAAFGVFAWAGFKFISSLISALIGSAGA